MPQVATDFVHSWLTCLFDGTGKRGSCLETVYSYLMTVPPTSVEAERAFSAVQLNRDHNLAIIQSTLCVSCPPFVFDLSLNVTKPHEVQTVVQAILSLFSGLILLVNWDV